MTGPQLQIQGERVSGQDVRSQNTTAALAVANVLKSSLGPVGLDKVCLNRVAVQSRLIDGV
jgi:T-complex protein 1 subunit alpha